MYQKDYILRIIEQMGALLRAMVSGIREQRPQDVREASREALTLLLGLPPEVTGSLTPDGLVTVLSVGGRFESTRGVLAAEVYVRRAQADGIAGLRESAVRDRARAARLLEEVVAGGNEADVARARELTAELEDGGATS
ncbi:MAG TPA: hypothetical protein VIK83_00510 [Coriobacteriia bacterium]